MDASNPKPKNTFFNLPLEKQERILDAAVSEFAGVGYAQASVNRIVSRVGIAKGSFYQYFDDKEALFLFVFEKFTRLVKEAVKMESSGAGRTFLEQLEKVLRAGLNFLERYPVYFNFYQKILSRDDIPRRQELLSAVRLFPVEYFRPLIEEAQREGRVRADLSSELMVFVIDSLLERFLLERASGTPAGGLNLAACKSSEVEGYLGQLIKFVAAGVIVESSE